MSIRKEYSTPTDEFTSRWQAIRSRLTSLVDQVLYSAVSLLQLTIYARLFEKTQFGIFSLALGIALVLIGIQRAAIIIPAIVLFPTPAAFRGSAHWAQLQFVFTLGSALTLAIIGLAAMGMGRTEIGNLCVLSSLLGGGILALDYQRRSLYQLRKQRAALLTSTIYLITSLLGLTFVAAWERSALGASVAASASACLAATAARLQRGAIDRRDGIGDRQGLVRATIGWNLLSFLPYTIYNNGMVLLVGAIAGPVTAAVFAATRLFIAPVQLLVTAIDNIDKPRASRALATGGRKALTRSLRGTSKTLLLLGLPYLIIIAAVPDVVGELLLGTGYEDDFGMARIWAAMGILLLLGQPIETGLVLLGCSKWLFACRCVAASVAVAGAALLLPRYGPAGAIWAIAVGWAVSTMQASYGLFMGRHEAKL